MLGLLTLFPILSTDQQPTHKINTMTMAQPPLRRRRQRFRIQIPILSRFLPIISVPHYLTPSFFFQCFASTALYLLGPVLILVTLGLLVSLSWTYWRIIIPLKFHSYSTASSVAHQAFVIFVLFNIVYNYILCVSTKHFGTEEYERTVRQLARATGFEYPDSEEDMDRWRLDLREKMLEKVRQKRLRMRHHLMSKYGIDEEKTSLSSVENTTHAITNTVNPKEETSLSIENGIALENSKDNTTKTNGSTLKNRKKEKNGNQANHDISAQPTGGRSWMWLGPNEWSYCERTRLPKPPRSHYDHVTKALVLNMDHYCPVSNFAIVSCTRFNLKS